MTEFFGICGMLAVCSSVLLLFCGREKELYSLVSVAIYVILTVYILSKVSLLTRAISAFFDKADRVLPIKQLLSAIGIATIGTVTSSICENVGQKGAAKAIDTLAVIEMMFVFLPFFKEVFENVLNFFE